MSSFWEIYSDKILPEPNSGCWLWMGDVNQYGYGRVRFSDGSTKVVHRVSYEMDCGTIPLGLDLDHLCRVRSCCNPAHLEPVTRATNLRRAHQFSHFMLPKIVTHCSNGHDLSVAGVYVRPNNSNTLECRACKRASSNVARDHRRALAKTGGRS